MICTKELQFLAYAKFFVRDRQGASAVEFALVFPLLMAVYILTLSFSIGAITAVKTNSVAQTASNLFASMASFTAKDVEGLQNFIKERLAPHAGKDVTYVVSFIDASDIKKAKYVWSRDSKGNSPYAKGEPFPYDKRIVTVGSYVGVEVAVPYKILGFWPVNGKDIAPTITFRGNYIVKQRTSPE